MHKRWKIGDFGTTSEGTSKRLRSTARGRGTAEYRAPELLIEDGGYNSKTDIWGFGCIAYEIYTKAKAFANEWETRNYKYKSKRPLKVFDGSQGWPSGRGSQGKVLKQLFKMSVENPLAVEWKKRPSASQILSDITNLRIGNE